MRPIDIPLGAFIPDMGGAPAPKSYLVDSVGIRLTPRGYRGMPQLQNVASSVVFTGTGTVGPGMIASRSNGEVRFLIIAETTASNPRLYTSADFGQTWASAIVLPSSFVWGYDFAPYDNRVFIAAGAASTTYFDLDAATLSTASAAPLATCAARVRDHLVVGGIWHTSDFRIEKTAVQWSAIGDPLDWPTPDSAEALAKQSGKQYLPRQFGWVGKIVGSEKFGLIFQERAITRMTYVGGDVQYEFDTFETDEGCGELDAFSSQVAAPAAVVEIGVNKWMWVNDHGAFVTDGYSVSSLSEGAVDEALFANTISFPDSIGGRARSAAYDQLRGVVLFKTGSTSQFCYNLSQKTFGFVESASYNSVFSGKTSLTNGKSQIYNVTSARQIQRLDGANDGIALQTGYIALDPGFRVQLQGAHVLGTGTSGLTLAYKAAETIAGCDVVQTGFTTMTAAPLGEMRTARASAQYFAFRVTGTGAESQLLHGIRVYFARAERAP